MEPDTSPEKISKVSESITDRPDGWLLREWNQARSIERQSAAKRGGNQLRISLDSVQPPLASDHASDANDDAAEFIMTLKAELPDDLLVIVDGNPANVIRDLA